MSIQISTRTKALVCLFGLWLVSTTVTVVRSGAQPVQGALDPEIIRRVVQKNASDVRACYEEGLRSNPDLGGRVVIHFFIARNGVVQTSRVLMTTVGGQVANCMAKAILGWTFPLPEDGGTVSVTYPWVLEPR